MLNRLLSPFRGYRIDEAAIAVKQEGQWLVLPRGQILAVEPQSVSRVIVRLHGGERHVLNLFDLPISSFEAITRALGEAAAGNEKRTPAP